MSSEDGRKILTLVQNRIESCLRMYMNQKEVVNTLYIQDNIEPHVTELVWQKLEEENPDFFRAYYLRLTVKEQIMEFNKLLSEQVQLMRQLGPAGISSISMSNGAPVPLMHQNMAACQAEERPGGSTLKAEIMQQQHSMSANLHNVFSNNRGSASMMQSCVQVQPPAPDMSSSLGRRMDISANNMLLAHQSSNRGVLSSPLIDGAGMIKSEPGYAAGSSSPFEFGAAHNNHHLVESRSALCDASVSSYSSGAESNSQPFNEASALLDADNPSFGLLEQISPHFNFTLSDFPTGLFLSFKLSLPFSQYPGRYIYQRSTCDLFFFFFRDFGRFF
ncbi:OLC1v1007713C3 [Oldenlandia corymbosa var. corymbosa]|uniref:OLC1v1007713C3 n=2 Tax=Oldenlandia corymbosa var. corymbosa TaxID=529605 RepID=A0AAV1DN24_OLDCO|nr:OLC1v1007713C3 [Oldenlandia corymbosa var. corymbosa]